MSDKATNFLKDNWFQFLSIIALGVFMYAGQQENTRRVDALERSGSPVMRERMQSLESKADFADKRLQSIESEAKQTAQVISDFRADLRLVVEWVKEQKRKEK